ncbi:hypothetical protein LCDVSa160L [Lymphocystis disease virus 3]|uniref:Uncharacterized protein n=1 Tax=Lymphocystis disease virus 3 TaxID=2560566 RepID=A0A1B2RW64_9VIRU|nr:hypothetical protein BZK12_gp160 [Lymphocystis disease virus Sa]AOC55244.1 hypothetical protein LCDVSa160L [Lymphocystis disease virus 3]
MNVYPSRTDRRSTILIHYFNVYSALKRFKNPFDSSVNIPALTSQDPTALYEDKNFIVIYALKFWETNRRLVVGS